MVENELPLKSLLFVVEQDSTGKIIAEVAAFVACLCSSRDWVLQAPLFVNETEDAASLAPDDIPRDYVGIFFGIDSETSLKAISESSIRELVNEVSLLMSSVKEFSKETKLDLEVWLDGRAVGGISAGELDQRLPAFVADSWRSFLRRKS